MTNRSNGYRSDSELFEKTTDQDVVRRNTRPLLSGFLETKNVYDNGTAETRSILVRECSLIYECNVCRNLFRCLANFMKHKRLYCRKSFHHMSLSIKENGYQDGMTDKRTNGKQKMTDSGSDNLSYLILKMLTGENKNKYAHTEEASDEGEKHRRSELRTKDSLQKNWKCRTRPIRNQGEATIEETTKREAEVEDTVYKPTSNAKTLRSTSDLENMCDICERKFDTKKSLKMHILKKHRPQQYGFQCPSCSLTFLKPAAVVQHLSSEHKKSIRCINLMRDAIQKRRVLNGETFIKTEAIQYDEKDVVPQQESISDNAFSCGYCNKSFQRKAVLLTHQNNCRLKDIFSIDNNFSNQSKTKESLPEEFAIPFDVSLNDSNKSSTDQSNASILSSGDLKSDSTQVSPIKQTIKNQEISGSQRNEQLAKSKYMPCLCKICNKHFSALSNLRRHISMIHYRTRKFACKLCEYRAFRKYDVINHLGHIHKILGDKDMMSLEYIDEHAEPIFREAFDEDIIIVTDDEKAKSMEDLRMRSCNVEAISENFLQSTSNSDESPNKPKNKYLKTYTISSAPVQKSASRKRQKLKRTISQQFVSTLDARHKRPKRNRITPVEKDFVYDLSTILKNEVNEKERESGRSIKRRDTVLLSGAPEMKLEETVLYRPLMICSADLIKGSAQKTAALYVHQGRAAYSSLPQLPSKRPQVRMRYAAINRADFVALPASIEATDPQKERLQTKLLDDSFLAKLSKTSTVDFKMKPRLALPQSTINSLLEKVDQTLQNHMRIKSEEGEIIESVPTINIKQEISIKEMDEKFLHAQSCEVGPAYSNYVDINQNKRFEIMQCLVANKPQSSESLLRLALEN